MSTSSPHPTAGPTPPLGLAFRLAAWPLAFAGWLLVRSLAATWRFELVEGDEHVDALKADERPVLFAAWHHALLPCSAWLLTGGLRRRPAPAFLVSRSRDGELVARLLRLWGARTVRGSSSRGGREALQALYRAVKREAVSVFSLPDGPRGPARRFKAGTLVLAQVTGAPVVPLACRASSAWRLRSWDRLVVPRPFARVRVGVGAPRPIPRGLEEDAQAAELRELEVLLDGLDERLALD